MGIEILRIILVYSVVFQHFGNISKYNVFFQFLMRLAVPSFILISYYLTGKHFSRKSINEEFIFKRLARFLIPFWGWGLIVYLVALIFVDIPISALFKQLLTGHAINPPLYFLFDQIVIFLIFSLVTKLTKKLIPYLLMLSIFALFFEYSSFNFTLFSQFPKEYGVPFGRLLELFPSAVLGFFLMSYHKKLIGLKYAKILLFLLLPVGFYIDQFFPGIGFQYQGIGILIASFGLVETFILTNLKIIGCRFILKLSSLSLGIFCSHYIVKQVLNGLEIDFSYDRIMEVNIIFVISLLVSLLISFIPNTITKRLVT